MRNPLGWKTCPALAAFLFQVAMSPPAAGDSPPPLPAAAQKLAGLDEFVRGVMQDWRTPGLAVAVTSGDEIVWCKGYGYRNVEQKLPVTPRTLFPIASVTKSFTAVACGILADEKKLDWDRPVREYLPAFRLHDQQAGELITPRDLLSHRSGLPRHDGLWYRSSLGRQEMVLRLRFLEPSATLRARYQYNNLMYVAAGYLAGELAGRGWEELVRERIFVPLRMERSNFSVRQSTLTDDFALPYLRGAEQAREIAFLNLDPMAPAGGINSNIEEMTRYLQTHLNRGKFGDQRLFSESAANQMQSPQAVMPSPPPAAPNEEPEISSYGLGLKITSYRGRRLLEHNGAIDGFVSQMSFMPGEKLGVVILVNLAQADDALLIVGRRIYDLLLGLEPLDWQGRVQTQREQRRKEAAEAQARDDAARKPDAPPSHPWADYAGDYEHPAYGLLAIEVRENGLLARFNGHDVRLEHYHYDVFRTSGEESYPPAGLKVLFYYDKQGNIDRVAVPLEPAVSDVVFTRRGASSR